MAEHNTDPAKSSEHGASRKHDRIAVTEEEDAAPHSTLFNDDGNKVRDVEYVGVRAPDADPDDRPLDPGADPESKPHRR